MHSGEDNWTVSR